MDISSFVVENKITIKNVKTDRNPNILDFEGDHWKSTIKMNGKQLTIPFSKGYGHNGKEPTIDEVLECLVLDAQSVLNYDECEFIDEYGYDCREGRKIYKECEKSNESLKKLFGDLYTVLMNDVEF